VADRLGQKFGNYRLVSLLGQGSHAEVYLGQHVRFNQQAAVKVLHAHLSGAEAEHFQQEAETIATLAHPSIIRVLDFDVQEGVPFLVIDYASGGTLRQRYPKGSLVPLPIIISSIKQVAAGLQYAHDKKYIHRDVKPENMLIGQHQEVLLSDFGIATIAHSTSSLSTSAEGTSGTLAYMAPEQIEGHPRPASDQYALGVVVYEWLCGERPFEGSVSELIAQHLSMPPLPLRERVPTIPAEVEQVVLRALAKDPKARFTSVADFASALEQASKQVHAPTAQLASEQPALGPAAATSYETVAVAPGQPVLPTETTPSSSLPMGALEPTVYPGSAAPHGLDTPLSDTPKRSRFVPPTAAVVSPPLEPTMPVKQKARHIPRVSAALLIGLVVVIIAGGVLGSVSLLAHFGVLGAHSSTAAPLVASGGTWTVDIPQEPTSLLPNASDELTAAEVEQALYLPLFYSDAQGVIHSGAASEVPTVQNGDISADATTWTFHLRPGLLWSDGQPYDARDIDYTWKLWLNPAFGTAFPSGLSYIGLAGLQLISSAVVSPDHLSITFHLKQPYVPFLQFWLDGMQSPLPAHHFSNMTPAQMAKSPDNLNPQVTSGAFLMAESDPGNHYTLERNPHYYLARQGLPYLDRVVFRIADRFTITSDLQAGRIDSTTWLDATQAQEYEGLHNYTLVTPATDAAFEGLFFNFHNIVLASHPEVRTAIADAIDYQSLVASIPVGLATPLCTDHGSFYHPGYDPGAPCPFFDEASANQLLDSHGWVRGPDGVRSKNGQRLEFDYAAGTQGYLTNYLIAGEAIIKGDLRAIGIQLDIQNYNNIVALMVAGKASPPTGAVAGRYDIAELTVTLGYDPDDSSLLSCQGNLDFYCNHTLDALYQQELETLVPGARQQIFAQIHQIYLTDFPFIVLYSPPQIALVRKGTHNYQLSPLGIQDPNVWQWWCDGGKC
jgi:peptide/nickel transport system substrate-binding protein